jgi:chromosomal replication initiator protein
MTFSERLSCVKDTAANESTAIPEYVAEFIAVACAGCSNRRAIEGIVIRLIAYCSLTGTPITLNVAQQILAETSLLPPVIH